MKKIILYILYIIIQCTWGIIQTSVGLIYFLLLIGCEHSFYHGCIRTKRPGMGGVSLGLFIFVTNSDVDNISSKVSVHEYGHTIQSLILGPLYIFIVGISSFIWCAMPYFRKKRYEKNIPYSSFWIESIANKFGEAITKEESLRDIVM